MKKSLSIIMALTILFSMFMGVSTTLSADGNFAWVLVDTYEFPIPADYKTSDTWNYYAKLSSNSAEIQSTIPWGVGIYASRDYDNPADMHAIYTWETPPSIIQPNQALTLGFEQSVISNKNGNYYIGFSPFLKADVADLELMFGTAGRVDAEIIYADGTKGKNGGIGYSHDAQAQVSYKAKMTLKFYGEYTPGDKRAIYAGVYGGAPGSVGVRYTYEWKETNTSAAITESNSATTTTVTVHSTQIETTSSGSTDLGKYSWEGEWDTNWGKMILVQKGSSVSGTYTHDQGRITGTVNRDKLIGTWSEYPNYSPPNDAGDIEFTMSADGKSFGGRWRYGSDGSWGTWDGGKRITEVIPAPTTPTAPTTPSTPATSSPGAEAFDSGARIMWQPYSGCLGFRMYRSKVKSQLGISVTDFYITSTSYADVNVEPNTTYYYTVKPVLAEANPYKGMEEKLGPAIATFTITTGNKIYKPGVFKHFIMMKLESPMLSVDGVEEEIDPGRGTAPIIITGRTMVPIRAVVEAMGGEVGWDQATQKITLKARGNLVEMWMNKTDIKINGVAGKMDVAPVAKNGRTFVPVRFAAENLNCKVDWINSTKEAVIVYEE